MWRYQERIEPVDWWERFYTCTGEYGQCILWFWGGVKPSSIMDGSMIFTRILRKRVSFLYECFFPEILFSCQNHLHALEPVVHLHISNYYVRAQ
jgi:hypothetical protein